MRCRTHTSGLNMIALSKETLAAYLLDDDPSVLCGVGRLLKSAGWHTETFDDRKSFFVMRRPTGFQWR